MLERGKRELLSPAAPEFLGLTVFHLTTPVPKAWIKSVGFLLSTLPLEGSYSLLQAALTMAHLNH